LQISKNKYQNTNKLQIPNHK